MNRQQRRRAARGKDKRPRGPGTAQLMKERQLGGLVDGFTKPQLDAMNTVSKERFGLGIGVVVQELERAELVVASTEPTGWWDHVNLGRRAARMAALADRGLWARRLREVAEVVAEQQLTARGEAR